MTPLLVTKLSVAHRQLVLAIRLFFNDADPVCVHTLVCASREIYEKHLSKAGGERLFDLMRPGFPDNTDKELWDALNGPRNFFKHAGGGLEEQIEFSDLQNDLMLWIACHDCIQLCGEKRPPEASTFLMWFIATEEGFGINGKPIDTANAFYIANLEQQYPGIRQADRAEKKRFGRAMFSEGGPSP